MSEDVRKAPVFDDAGNETSRAEKPERVLLDNGRTGYHLGEGFGLYVDPDTSTLNIAEVVEGEPDERAHTPTDYETYFAVMVIRSVVPIVVDRLLDGEPLSDEELTTFYAPPVIEDHPLPAPKEEQR